MRIFHKINALAFSAACIVAVSCAKDNPKDGTVKARSYNYFTATASYDDVSSEGGAIHLAVNSNVSWKITADESLTPEVKTGKGKDTVDINVPENTSFSTRSFNFAVSTEDELDDDEPTVSFQYVQPGITPKFYVDTNSLKVPSVATSASVILTENVGYEIVCETPGLSCTVTDDPQSIFRHSLNFSFPANMSENPVIYKATINPKTQPASEIKPIQISIRQSGYVKIVIDCTNAADFRYDKAGIPTALPTTAHGKDFVTGDFWLKDSEQYVFNGSVKNWGATLNAEKNSPVKLPAIPGLVLVEVDVTYSKPAADRTYRVTDGVDVLGQCTRNASTTIETKIDLSSVSSERQERYLLCTLEMGAKFRLTYVSAE